MNPFTEEEALKYLSLRGIVNEEVIRVILNLSKRLPLLVATLASERPNDLSQIEDINSTAIDCFLKWVKDPNRRRILLDAALARVVNRDILEVLIGKEETTASFNWFKQMPFIKKTLNGWVYHDVVRPHMLHHKHIETPQNWSNLHARLAGFYKESKDKLQLDDEEKMTDVTWQEFAREEVYHLLCESPQKHLSVALDDFIAALASSSFGHRWAEMIQQAGEDSEDRTVKYWGELLITGLNDREEKPCEKLITMLSELLNHYKIDSKQRTFLLGFRVAACCNSQQQEQALVDLEELTQIQPDNATNWFLKAVILMGLDRHEEYKHALARMDEVDPIFMPNLIVQYYGQLKAIGQDDEFIESLKSKIVEHDILNNQE